MKQTINRSISSENVDEIIKDETLFEGIIKVFNRKDYLNKNLFELESHLETLKKS